MRVYVFLSLFFIILSPSISYADKASPTLVIASVGNIPPYVYYENGTLAGVSIDIVNELSKRAGFNVEIRTMPWARVLHEVEYGQVDAAFSAYRTEEREKYALYTGIFYYDELDIAVLKDAEFKPTSLEDLYGKTVTKGRGVFVSDEFDAAVRSGKIKLFDIDDMDMKNVKMLIWGRVDAVIGSPMALMKYAKEIGAEDEIALFPFPHKEKVPAYFILSKASPLKDKKKWQEKITSVLEEMRSDGTIQRITDRYHLKNQ